ncbi:MAG: RNase adapter RapZ [Gammaproteobacteria bacterium]|nr:RNase adapter RapZ [Gammaproteobacteria bacterium]
MKLVIVSGLSGSGKSSALRMLEDLGFFCTDNLPLPLLESFTAQMLRTNAPKMVAVGIDARSRVDDAASLPERIETLRGNGIDCEILFLEADDPVLLARFSETRRKHPLTHDGIPLEEAIAQERKLLGPIAASAALHVDTSRTNIHQLRETVKRRVVERAEGQMSLVFQSFGYKHGVPRDADYVFDLRCLPNPFWEPELRDLTGLDAPVAAYLAGREEVREMQRQLTGLLEAWIPRFEAENRSYLTVALGCTGGRHRSVYLAERMREHFAGRRADVSVRHREFG